jgi:hypothetical protein
MEENRRRGFCLSCADVYSVADGTRIPENGYIIRIRDTVFGICGECTATSAVPAERTKEKFIPNFENV